jgi:hypothetical protein
MWRLLSPAILPLVLASAAYLASPLVAAHRLQRAIMEGDVASIEAKVDWPGLRSSIKRSLRERLSEAAASRPEAQTFLQRVGYRMQDALAPGFIDRTVERGATPEGFARYFHSRPDQMGAPSGIVLRVRGPRLAAGGSIAATAVPPPGMLSQIGAAAFLSPARFSFEVADRHDPARRYRAELELRQAGWVLTRVEVLSLGSGRLD